MTIVAITAKVFDLRGLENVEKTLDVVSKDAQRDYQRFANSFDETMPTIEVISSPNERLVIPKRNEDGRILSFVVSGTSVRFAKMDNSFTAKTRPGSLITGPGSGGLAYVGNIPLPGIEARDTHQLLADKYGDELVDATKKALNKL